MVHYLYMFLSLLPSLFINSITWTVTGKKWRQSAQITFVVGLYYYFTTYDKKDVVKLSIFLSRAEEKKLFFLSFIRLFLLWRKWLRTRCYYPLK